MKKSCSKGILWFGTPDGVIRYDRKNFQDSTVADELVGNFVTSILEDSEGNLWFGTYNGVSRYDGIRFENFTTKDGLASHLITCISEDREGSLWFGSHSGVVSRCDKSVEEFTSLEVQEVMIKDREGNLWFGVRDRGVCKYDGKGFTNYTKTDGLCSNRIGAILQDSSGNFWFGSFGGLSKYDGKEFRNFTKEDGLADNALRSILEDSQGNLWFGTNGGGVSRYDGDSFINFTTADGLAHNNVWAILEDNKGNLWFGTWGGGVSRYDGKSFTNFTTEDGLANDMVRAILEDSKGNLWFATANGVSKYDGQNFTNFNVEQGLLASRIQSIYEDSQGNLWFGTLGGGACKFDGLSFQALTEEDGMASNAIWSILEDETGALLFATPRGITKYRKTKSSVNEVSIPPTKKTPPPIYITKVVANQIYTDCNEIEIPSSVKHITIEYHGVSFKTKRMGYIYKLEGMDRDWKFTWEERRDYENLTVGEYLFKVKAISRDLEYSQEPAVMKITIVPDSRDKIIAHLQKEVTSLKRQLGKKYSFENIVGENHKMEEVFALIEKAIDSDITVLIIGETGTGKELVARAIHYNSKRKDKPFVVQNCAAIPQNLLESELFGHVKGAFTGAIQNKKGLFESTDDGTLFLDEIGDMSQDLQARLLRVLEDGEIKRVGDTHSKLVDVRIIAVTNKNLWEEVSAGRFREDLYYRLTAFPITLPPLRERSDDIPALAAHFLKKCNKSMKKSITGFDSEAMLLLMDYPWPGNVRELENEIKRAAALADDNEIITPFILSDKIKGVVSELQVGDDKTTSLGFKPQPMKTMMEKVERSLIKKALKRNGGNVTRTAIDLNISRVTLQKKMKKYRLREE